MVGRVFFVVGLVAALVVGCSSNEGDSNEGNACGKQGDCGGNLSCQPVAGRTADFCCPTPPESSKQSNCHGVN
jgi:hypothetical protein